MSVQAITWALGRASGIAPQAVLFSLANHADEWGITFVGQDTVAGECSCRRPTVTTNMARLEEDGLIKRFQRRDGGGRRSSDIVVLAPNWGDRAAMHDAEKRAATMFSEEVCAAARQGTPGEHWDQGDQRPPDEPQGTPHESLGTLGVHEPSEEPSEEPTASSSSAGAGEWAAVPAEMRSDAEALLKRKAKVDSRLVTPDEMRVAAAALAEFNRQAGSDYGLGANMRSIVMRIRDRPSAGADVHVRLVQSAWRVRWWERTGNGRKPSPNVIYGEKSFENVWQDAVDEAKGDLKAVPVALRDRVWWDGRRFDELTPGEQANAREAVSMHLKPWERQETVVAVSNNGTGLAPITAETWLSSDD